MTEWGWKDSTAGQSQLAGEAEGSRNAGTRGTVGAALTMTGRVGIIRRRGPGAAESLGGLISEYEQAA